MREEIESLRQRVEVLEHRLPAVEPGKDWRAALKRAQEGWASMDPELRAECLATFEEVERRSRAPRVND